MRSSASPSSAVRKTVLLICSHLRGFSGVFLHYILDKFGALGQAEAEVGEQEGDIGVGLGHGAQAQGEHAFGAFDRDGDWSSPEKVDCVSAAVLVLV